MTQASARGWLHRSFDDTGERGVSTPWTSVARGGQSLSGDPDSVLRWQSTY